MAIISTSHIWARAIIITTSIFCAGYSIGVINTLQSRVILNFNWSIDDQSNNTYFSLDLFLHRH